MVAGGIPDPADTGGQGFGIRPRRVAGAVG
jgi:hypothetical protein